MSDENNFMFLYHLYEYNLRREQALGYVEPSAFLLSLQSTILLESSTRFLHGAQRMEKAEKLYQVITVNERRIKKLSGKIKKANSTKRARTWYRIVLELYEEAKKAQEELAELEANG